MADNAQTGKGGFFRKPFGNDAANTQAGTAPQSGPEAAPAAQDATGTAASGRESGHGTGKTGEAAGAAPAKPPRAGGKALAIPAAGDHKTAAAKRMEKIHGNLTGHLAYFQDAVGSLGLITSLQANSDSPSARDMARRTAAFQKDWQAAVEAKNARRSEVRSDRVKRARELGELLAKDEGLDIEAMLEAARQGGLAAAVKAAGAGGPA